MNERKRERDRQREKERPQRTDTVKPNFYCRIKHSVLFAEKREKKSLYFNTGQ